jgi:hypothetical protein
MADDVFSSVSSQGALWAFALQTFASRSTASPCWHL